MISQRDNTELIGGGTIINGKFYPKMNLPSGTIRIVLTTECNFNCKYCFAEGENKSFRRLEPEYIRKVILIGKEFGINKVKLTGGEPTLYPKLEEVLQIIADEGIEYVDLTTNISLLNEEMINKLNYFRVNALTLSLHTLNPEKFQQISGGYSSFDKILENLDRTIKNFNGKVRVNSVVFDELFEIDDYMSIFNFCKKNNLGLRFVEPTKVDKMEITQNKNKFKFLIEEIEKMASKRVDSLCTSVRYYFFDKWYVTVMNSLCDNLLCDSCKKYMYLRLTSEGKLKPCLSRKDTEIPIDINNQDDIRRGFILAIDSMGKGLNCV